MTSTDITQLTTSRAWLDELDIAAAEEIGEARGQLLEQLTTGIHALQQAAATIERLRGSGMRDAQFADGRDGRDVATFCDDSIRYARAAYAVVHTVIDKEVF